MNLQVGLRWGYRRCLPNGVQAMLAGSANQASECDAGASIPVGNVSRGAQCDFRVPNRRPSAMDLDGSRCTRHLRWHAPVALGGRIGTRGYSSNSASYPPGVSPLARVWPTRHPKVTPQSWPMPGSVTEQELRSRAPPPRLLRVPCRGGCRCCRPVGKLAPLFDFLERAIEPN